MIVHCLISFFITLACLLLLLKTSLSRLALDKPNARSLHTHITPRTGGLAVMAGTLASWLVTDINLVWVFLVAALVSISLIDDMRSLSARWRFMAQLIVAGIFLLTQLHGLGAYVLIAALFCLVWVTNLYNFMDGSDGLAGGMAIFGFGAYAIAAYLAKDIPLALMCVSLISASLAFLMFNFHPAKIFMGDAGSIPLGFLAGAIGLYGFTQHLWELWFPVLVFSPFILDATVTLIKRALRGEKVWQAHREHYYQRLIQMGWSHGKLACAEYLLMLLSGVVSVLMLKSNNLIVSLTMIFWLLMYIVLMWRVDLSWLKHVSSNAIKQR